MQLSGFFMSVPGDLDAALGSEHPDLIDHLECLITTLEEQGKDKREPRLYYQQILAIKEINLGPTHPEVVHVLIH